MKQRVKCDWLFVAGKNRTTFMIMDSLCVERNVLNWRPMPTGQVHHKEGRMTVAQWQRLCRVRRISPGQDTPEF